MWWRAFRRETSSDRACLPQTPGSSTYPTRSTLHPGVFPRDSNRHMPQCRGLHNHDRMETESLKRLLSHPNIVSRAIMSGALHRPRRTQHFGSRLPTDRRILRADANSFAFRVARKSKTSTRACVRDRLFKICESVEWTTNFSRNLLLHGRHRDRPRPTGRMRRESAQPCRLDCHSQVASQLGHLLLYNFRHSNSKGLVHPRGRSDRNSPTSRPMRVIPRPMVIQPTLLIPLHARKPIAL